MISSHYFMISKTLCSLIKCPPETAHNLKEMNLCSKFTKKYIDSYNLIRLYYHHDHDNIPYIYNFHENVVPNLRPPYCIKETNA